MSAHIVIACDALTVDEVGTEPKRCTNGKSVPASVPPATGRLRAGLKASGWRSVRIRHLGPFRRADGSVGTSQWSELKDYCPEHRGQIPKPADRTVTHPLYEYPGNTLEEGPDNG